MFFWCKSSIMWYGASDSDPGVLAMSEAVAQILSSLDGLSQAERAEIAYTILQSLEPEDADAAVAWDQELARRVERIRNGQAVGIPVGQVFADWRRSKA
jgi:putative addiction module component (TIGR02574 family)